MYSSLYQPVEFKTRFCDLPNELLPLIFQHLPIRDLISCSMVNRRSRFLVRLVQMQELVVHNHKSRRLVEKWFQQDHLIKVNIVNGLHFNLIDNLPVHKLHRLCINEVRSLSKLEIESLINPMCQLNHLELTISCNDNHTNEAAILKLPSLQTLKLFTLSRFEIQSTKLQTVYLYMSLPGNLVKFSNPESIKFLKVDKIPESANQNFNRFSELLDLVKYSNVEILRLNFCSRYAYSRYGLSRFYQHAAYYLPKLNQLHFDRSANLSKHENLYLKRDFTEVIKMHLSNPSGKLKFYILGKLIQNRRSDLF